MATQPATTTTLAQLQAVQSTPETNKPPIHVGFTDSQGFELVQRIAKMFGSSSLVPNDYQNNIPNCVIALNMASRIGADPLMVMQNLYVVHGRPSWSSQFLIATFNTCGRFSALRYEFFGEKGTDEWGCRASAIEKASGEQLLGSDITIALAKSEGWYGKKGSKWVSMPQQMLQYRAASWFVRAYAPEIAMGLSTVEEAIDIPQNEPTTLAELRTPEAIETTAEVIETVSDLPDANPETGEIEIPEHKPMPEFSDHTATEGQQTLIADSTEAKSVMYD